MAVYNLSHYPCSFYRASRVEPRVSSGRHLIIHDFAYEYPPAPVAMLPAWSQQCRAGSVACAIKTIPVASKKMAESRSTKCKRLI
jgi:hypothetical protein